MHVLCHPNKLFDERVRLSNIFALNTVHNNAFAKSRFQKLMLPMAQNYVGTEYKKNGILRKKKREMEQKPGPERQKRMKKKERSQLCVLKIIQIYFAIHVIFIINI